VLVDLWRQARETELQYEAMRRTFGPSSESVNQSIAMGFMSYKASVLTDDMYDE